MCLAKQNHRLDPTLAYRRSLIEEGGDWDRRNRLKVYEGLYLMSIRNFKAAATLFLDTVSTFTSIELLDYKTFVSYAVYCCVFALDRVELGKKVCVPSAQWFVQMLMALSSPACGRGVSASPTSMRVSQTFIVFLSRLY